MTTLHLSRAATPAHRAGTSASELPAWPLLALLHGFPIFWALGLAPFITPLTALVMLAFLVRHPGVRLVPGLAPFAAFIAWVAASGVMLSGFGQAIGFTHRLAELAALGVVLLYYVNATSITPRRILSGLMTIWATVVMLGVLAIFLPDLRLTTPTGLILPGAIVDNELVRELVNPRMAEVQQPWGAEEPFNRPAAPFPYTNSWGMAFVLLTPLALLRARQCSSARMRAVILGGVALSLWPAVETSNRGMFLGLGLVVAALLARWIGLGHHRRVLTLTLVVATVVTVLLATGTVAEILARQEVSNTTEGRGTIYRATFTAVLESPLLGWATPRMDPSIGISLGTQGYLWTLLFCYGFVGAGLFVLFMTGALVRTVGLRSDTAVVAHSLLVVVTLTIAFYGLGTTQLTIVGLLAVMLLRARHDGETL